LPSDLCKGIDEKMISNIETFIGCDDLYADSDIIIFGAPFDGTTSFKPGARFAPKEIRTDSFGIETYSPYQNKDLEDVNICDIGDLEFPFGNTEKVLSMIKDQVDKIVEDKKIPIMIGGEHLITLGAIRSLYKKYPDLCLIQFDAHSDFREEYLGEEMSHATVMRRVWDILGDGSIYQFGIRSGEREELAFAEEHAMSYKFDLNKIPETLKNFQEKDFQERPVYITIDLDVLDPSIFPGTGTPEPGGVSFNDLLSAINLITKLKIVGCDIAELSPHYDRSGVSTIVACKIIRELLLGIS
jgi:agmatinase